jgi:hypothetical protein
MSLFPQMEWFHKLRRPQQVGKASEAYRMAQVAYEMVLLRAGK